MNSRCRRVYAFDRRAGKPDGSYVEGHCAIFNSIDEYGTIMARGCFDRWIEPFRRDGFIGGLNHDWDDPVGKVEKAELDDTGLLTGGSILDTSHGMDLRKLLAGNVIKFLSFGFDVMRKDWLDKPDQVEGYWKSVGYTPNEDDVQRARGGAVLFTEVRPYEFSPCMVPGNQNARITEVRSDGPVPLDNHLQTVRDAVGGLCDRLESLARLRADDGRQLPPERAAAVRSLIQRLEQTAAACQPTARTSDVAAIRASVLEFQRFSLTSGILA